MVQKIQDNLKNELTDVLLECIGIEQLKQVLLELASSETNEQNEEIWLQAFDILTKQETKGIIEYKSLPGQINSGRFDAYTSEPCDIQTYI